MKRHAIVFGIFVTLAVAAEANVIFPAFSAPYISQIFFPVVLVATLITEAAVYKLRCRSLSMKVVLLLVIGVNLVSWLVGVPLTAGLFPSGLVKSPDGILSSGPDFTLYAQLGYLVAYGLSVFIEGACLVAAARKWPIPSPFELALFANTASYIVLGGMMWWLW